VTSRRTSTEVPYSSDQMFSLVADVERYPEFLPWCVALRIADRRQDGDADFLTCDMIVTYKVFREKFRSLVRLDRNRKTIDVDYVDGPFRSLRNDWGFQELAHGGSKVDFSIAFEFRSIVLQATAQAVFEKAFLKMSEAFIERARSVYGATSPLAQG